MLFPCEEPSDDDFGEAITSQIKTTNSEYINKNISKSLFYASKKKIDEN